MIGRQLNKKVILAGLVAVFGLSGIISKSDDVETKESCLGCHKKYKKEHNKKFIHKPFQDEDCYSCHNFHGFANKLELKGKVIEICTFCHNFIEDIPEENRHEALFDDESCTFCHDPHSSDVEHLLKKEPADLCMECHDQPAESAGIHKPYLDKKCITCHSGHGSLFPPSLIMPTRYLCLECHPNILASTSSEAMHTTKEFRSCENCHDGHSSKNGRLLLSPQPDLCFNCHSDIQEMTQLENQHVPFSDGECTNCHNPHENMISKDESTLCGECHDFGDSSFLKKHFQIGPQRCITCHNPHASGNVGLIRNYEHGPFAERECDICHESATITEELKNNELCLNCHDLPDAEGEHEPLTDENTRCIDCHNPHSAKNQVLTRKF